MVRAVSYEDLSVAQELAPLRPESLSDVYRLHFDEMVRLAYLLTSSEETASDIVQDCFVRMQVRWSSIEEPRAYLQRSVVNACRSHHRRLSLRRDQERAVPVAEPYALGADELGDALAKLPERQRSAVVLRFYGGLSEAEIAECLGCRPGTVGSLIHRGVAALREVIER
jgi:RNA polymerase sigma factor (sigma-70 family)